MAEHGHSHGGKPDGPSLPVGQTDTMVSLNDFITPATVTVLNNDAKTSVASIFGDAGTLKSDEDVDAQLLIVVPFKEKVKIRGIRFIAEGKDDKTSGPKKVKLFVDRPNYSFDDAGSAAATQVLDIPALALASGEEQKLKYVKFQSVSSITLFIESNQGDTDVTILNKLEFVGCPIDGFQVAAIKKIGED